MLKLRHGLRGVSKQLGNRYRSAQLVVAILLLSGAAATPQDSPPIVINPGAPSSYWLAAGGPSLSPPEPQHGPVDLASGNIGWFEFAFTCPEAGWRRLVLEARPPLGAVELELDAATPASPDQMAISGSLRPGDWVWLDAGPHRLRVIQNIWIGMPQISGIRLEAPGVSEPGPFRLIRNAGRSVAGVGRCAPIQIEAGGGGRVSTLEVVFWIDGRFLEARQAAVPAADRPVRLDIDAPCSRAGDVTARVSNAGGLLTSGQFHEDVRYSVFDTSRVEPAFHRGELVREIDATTQDPEFGSGLTAVVRGGAGDYRETIDRGTTPYVRSGGKGDAPGWFAYRLTGLTPGKPYLFEVEYPDDAERTFVVAFRDSAEPSYPVSIGAETGGIWPVSGAMAHMDALVWPASSDARALVLNVHNGMKAAISHIRIYAIDIADRVAAEPQVGRQVVAWYEEGENFRSLVGEAHDPASAQPAVDRYLRLARSMGATRVSPSVLVYGSELYPSKFNLTFNDQRSDLAAAFFVGAERYGMTVVPEMHPRADELLWPARDRAELDRRLLMSADGASNRVTGDGSVRRPPYYNALDPDVRQWYLEMIGEFVERYRDYRSFSGIQLRISDWQNPALNNVVSLDWGYDRRTVSRFFGETGLAIPAGMALVDDEPVSARNRHDLILANVREAWIRWRCERVRDIFRDVVQRVREARSDLTVQVSFFALSGDERSDAEHLREMGIDLTMLGAVEGLSLVDARFQHGAKEASLGWRRATREGYLGPNGVGLFERAGTRASTLFPMHYIEITGKVATSQQLGWPARASEPWISAASEPPGRLKLARYAELVGLFDVAMLGDGGNGYVFPGKGLEEFMTEFRALPPERFELVPNIPAPVIVRERGDLFYVVNLSSSQTSVRLSADRAGKFVRLSNGAEVTTVDGAIRLDMAPYELIGFRSVDLARIARAEVLESSAAIAPARAP